MRKRLVTSELTKSDDVGPWLDLALLVQVEITSEAPEFPIEAALAGDDKSAGWRAADSGEQLIRLLFDAPQRITRIAVEFYEPDVARTQEFSLRWSSDGKSYHDVVRQQFNFNPTSSPREHEQYEVNLAGVRALELRVNPDISSPEAVATLRRLRLA